MKLSMKRTQKSVISVLLTLCMLVSCVTVALIPTGAAVVSDSGAVAARAEGDNVGYYWGGGTYYMKGSFNNWGELSGTNNSSNTQQHYYYIYANGSSTNADITFKFKEEDGSGNDSWFGAGDTNSIGTSGKQIYENGGENIHLNRKNLGTTDTTWYKLKIWFEHKGSCYCWYEKDTTKTALTPTITTKKGSTSTTQFTAGDTVSLSTSTTNNFGTVTYSYEYKKGSGSYQSISGTSFVPTSAGTYTIRVTANDGAVVEGTNSESARTATATKEITVSVAETTYSVSVESEDASKGTVAANTVSAGNTAVTIPTATPAYGYKFKNWTTTSSSITITNETSASAATVKATAAGTVTANFEPDDSLELYIAGRFHIWDGSSWINSFDSGDWSTTGDDNIQFTFDSSTHKYKLETNASIQELSSNIKNIEPYFFVYDKTNTTAWHSKDQNTSLNLNTTSADLSTNDATYNVRFESTATDSPVVLYFDATTKTLTYSTPSYFDITCSDATGGTVTSDPVRQKVNETVTLTLTPSEGYQVGTVTVTKAGGGTVSLSGSGNTRTFAMPADSVTVSATFTEITHTIHVRKRFYQSDGTTLISTDSTDTQTISGAGITTAQTVNAAPSVDYYTFNKFTLPTGVTLASGDLNTAAAITVNATVDDAIIYIDYKETLYTLTLVNQDSHGTIKQNGTSAAITSIQVGNITGVTLVATPYNGYQFNGWSKSSNAVTIGNAANASTTFKTSANATVTANYTAVNYTITATANPASGAKVEVWNTAKTQQISGGHIGDKFRIYVTMHDGYAFDSISGVPSGGSVITNDAASYVAEYTLSNSNVNAVITLKAATPTLSNVQIKNTTFTFATPGNPTENYYLQPTEVKATTDSFSTLGYNNTAVNQTGKASDVAVSLTQPTKTLNAEDATADYTLTITATNAPSGVTAATKTESYTIRVKFNDAQKQYFKLQELYKRCVQEESTSNNPYYTEGAPIAAYNTASAAAQTYLNQGYPAYNATAEDTTAAEEQYNSFKTAYENLMKYAKKTTVYVLTKYARAEANPVYFHVSGNGNNDDWKHFKMYDYGADAVTNDTYKTTFAGTFTASGASRYLYSFTFTGHMNFIVWRGTSATDTQMDGSDKLTGDVTNVTAFKGYYIDVYNTNVGSTAVNSAVDYVDFNHTIASGKKFLEINDERSAAQIKALFSITPVSSLITSPGITVTNTAFTIEGPVDKGDHTIVDLTEKNFIAKKQGRYIVKYTTKFGTDASGSEIKKTQEMTLYVAFDDVTVYVDMNDNIGTPILNFKYWQKNEQPVAQGTAGATEAYLPYEMDLVTGSESIYKYTVKTSKLKNDYFLNFDADHPLNISYITVERTNYSGTGNAGFDILSEARITGEIWFKADSTHMTTFKTISCGSVTKSFAAVTTGGTLLSAAVNLLHGTGINTDVDEVYKAQYAGLYKLEGAAAYMNNFHYVLNASVNSEVKLGSDTYAFDKWIAVSSANVTYTPNENTGVTTVAYTNGKDKSAEQELTFTRADEYGDGENDVTYIAVFKQVGSGQPMRVEITYKFKDFDTSDGNYVYDGTLDKNGNIAKTVDADYTKTVTTTYTDTAAAEAAINAIAQANAPHIKSNYFDYSYKANSATKVKTQADESKLVITAELTETPHPYTIILKKGDTLVDIYTGYFQQPVKLASGGCTNPVWKDSSGNIIGSGATGSTFAARYVSSRNEEYESTDCQIIKVEDGTSTAANNTSVVSNAYTEVYYTDNGTEMLRHNFYIIDYCTEGKLIGGGVLFATTDATTGNYRQTNAGTALADATSRQNFISGILGTDFTTEYKAQTINNVGFRYKPFKNTEDVYRYSDDLKAYITLYEGTNVNSDSYDNQNLRLFSFMIYDNNGNNVIVPSNGYAEVARYQPQN